MHATSIENMQKCYDRYVRETVAARSGSAIVLDVGGSDVNGSYRSVFPESAYDYRGCDLKSGPGVTIVMDDPYRIPLDSGSVDIVLCGQMLEHCEFFWLMFAEMMRVLKDDGRLFLIAPSAGPIHRYPVDCYRFYPDAYAALAKFAGCHLVECWLDERGPWKDLVGVFSKQPLERSTGTHLQQATDPSAEYSSPEGSSQGEISHLKALQNIHRLLEPTLYLEIGVSHGRSLRLAKCRAVGVDPASEIAFELPPTATFVQATSDDFFESKVADILGAATPDLIFIDGMHLYEYALRDFINAEKLSPPHGLIVIDDVIPNHPAQASRERRTKIWTGDVWKLPAILRRYRPDLYLLPLDTSPVGMLAVAGLDSTSRILAESYNSILKAYNKLAEPPKEALSRENAHSPAGPELKRLISKLKQVREGKLKKESLLKRLRV
ncbi:hypothetical protein BH10PSE6_BH10PSE6_43570 [soil metagenome]